MYSSVYDELRGGHQVIHDRGGSARLSSQARALSFTHAGHYPKPGAFSSFGSSL